jgi:hypothetical protein
MSFMVQWLSWRLALWHDLILAVRGYEALRTIGYVCATAEKSACSSREGYSSGMKQSRTKADVAEYQTATLNLQSPGERELFETAA